MVTSQTLKSVDFTKTQEPNVIFSSNKKINELLIKGFFMAKNSFVVEEPLMKAFFLCNQCYII